MAQTPEVNFRSIAKDFLQISTLLKDEWELEQQNGSIYLRKQQVMKVKRPDIQTDGKTQLANNMELAEGAITEDLGEADPACLESCKTAEDDVLKFDFHVLYSESYGVPVLYFNIYRQDGSLVSLDGVWNLVPPVYQERLKEERWTFITQQEHPYLGRPFYQLHPCHTASLMSQVGSIDESDKRNYLVSWLSAVGPVVHLTLPLEYGLGNSSM